MLVAAIGAWLLGRATEPSEPRPDEESPAEAAEATELGDDELIETSPSAASGGRIVIGIPVRDPAVVGDELDRALGGHLAGTGLRHRVAALSDRGEVEHRLAWASTFTGEAQVLAVFWLEGTGDERRLYLFDPRAGATWVRELPSTDDSDALLETVGAMIRSISLWLEHGPPPGMAAVAASPPEPAPPPPIAPASLPSAAAPAPASMPPRWGIELAYLGSTLATDVPWQSGAGLGVELEWASGAVGGLTVGALSPTLLDGAPETRLWRVPVGLSGGYRFRSGRALRPLVDGTLVAEPWRWSARTTDEAIGRSGAAVRIAVSPGVGLRWEAWRGLALLLHARADIWVLNSDLVVSIGGTRVPRLVPHAIAACARAGVGYRF